MCIKLLSNRSLYQAPESIHTYAIRIRHFLAGRSHGVSAWAQPCRALPFNNPPVPANQLLFIVLVVVPRKKQKPFVLIGFPSSRSSRCSKIFGDDGEKTMGIPSERTTGSVASGMKRGKPVVSQRSWIQAQAVRLRVSTSRLAPATVRSLDAMLGPCR